MHGVSTGCLFSSLPSELPLGREIGGAIGGDAELMDLTQPRKPEERDALDDMLYGDNTAVYAAITSDVDKPLNVKIEDATGNEMDVDGEEVTSLRHYCILSTPNGSLMVLDAVSVKV